MLGWLVWVLKLFSSKQRRGCNAGGGELGSFENFAPLYQRLCPCVCSMFFLFSCWVDISLKKAQHLCGHHHDLASRLWGSEHNIAFYMIRCPYLTPGCHLGPYPIIKTPFLKLEGISTSKYLFVNPEIHKNLCEEKKYGK